MSDIAEPPEDDLEPELDFDAPERHPKPGRPRRADWRPPASLLAEPPGCAVLIDGTWTPFRVRARLLGTRAAEYALLSVDDEQLEVPLARIRRYRPLGSVWLPGDLVLRRDVPVDAWRGVVRDSIDSEVTVETMAGIEVVDADELVSAWATEETPKPVFKRGPVSDDPVLEAVNTEAIRSDRGDRTP